MSTMTWSKRKWLALALAILMAASLLLPYGPVSVAKAAEAAEDIAAARELGVGAEVAVSGIVTSEPGIYGSQAFAIQDDSAGLYVYTNGNYGVSVGDEVYVQGKLKEYNGLLEFDSVASVEVVSSDNELPAVQTVTAEELNENGEAYESELIQLQGVTIEEIIEENTYGTFSLNVSDETGEAKVYTDNRTGMDYDTFVAEYEVGDVLDITGLGSQFYDEYELKTRGEDDFALSEAGEPGEGTADFTLTIMHHNDSHAHLENVARLATKVKEIRAENPDSLLIHAGDVFTGTLYFTQWLGQADLEFMNALEYDLMTLGNHEFDKTSEVLADFIDDAQFPVVNANFDFSADPVLSPLTIDGPAFDKGQPGDAGGKIAPWVVMNVAGEAVGFFGLTTEDTAEIANPSDNIVIGDAMEAAEEAVVDLTTQGVDKIVAVSHLGVYADEELAESVDGIDVIVGGHSHTKLEAPMVVDAGESPTLIVQAEANMAYLGLLEAAFDEEGNVLPDESTGNLFDLSEDGGLTEDPEIKEMLNVYDVQLEEVQNQVVGTTDVYLDGERDHVRIQETNLGNLIADGMLWKANELNEADVAIQNGGGIRAPIDAGEITLGELLTVLPFGNTLAVADLTGAQIIEALENGVSQVDTGAGRFPQVSGMRFVWNPEAEPGSRIVSVEIKNDDGTYMPIDESQTYRVATNNFMLTGGDGYVQFEEASYSEDLGFVDYEVFQEYLVYLMDTVGTVSPQVEGRIQTGSGGSIVEPGASPLSELGSIGTFTDSELHLPEGATFQRLISTGDLLGDGNTFRGNNDLTIFLPKDGTSSTEGRLWVNHELKPGGASILDLVKEGGEWQVTGGEKVDFSSVGGTWTNCAGTLTPWGTILTAEEYPPTPAQAEQTYNNRGEEPFVNDANEYGWMVEVNPETGEMRKLYAMGRFSHESGAILPDNKTVILSDDDRGGALFKFVAAEAGDLSRGILYALTVGGEWVEIADSTTEDPSTGELRETLNNARQVALDNGATVFYRGEDVEYNPVTGKVYLAVTGNDQIGGTDAIGREITVEDSYGEVVIVDPVSGEISTFVQGGPETGMFQPDNLAIDAAGNVWIAEDKYGMYTNEEYGNNHVWVADTAGDLKRFASMPAGAEGTGPWFTPDNQTLFLAIQHPDEPFAEGVVAIQLAGQSVPGETELSLEPLGGIFADGQFTLELNAKNVEDLYGASVELSFDPAQLQVVDQDAETEGVQILSGQLEHPIENEVDNENGKIYFTATQLGEVPGLDGDVTLASVQFEVLADAGATITITPELVQMANSANEELAVTMAPFEETVLEKGRAITGKISVPASVHLEDLSGFTVSLLSGDKVLASAVTEEDGTYTLMVDPTLTGTYQLKVERPGYVTTIVDVEIAAGDMAIEITAIEGLVGDFNGDGMIDISDISQMALQYRQPVTGENEAYDVDKDGDIDLYDVVAVALNFGYGEEEEV